WGGRSSHRAIRWEVTSISSSSRIRRSRAKGCRLTRSTECAPLQRTNSPTSKGGSSTAPPLDTRVRGAAARLGSSVVGPRRTEYGCGLLPSPEALATPHGRALGTVASRLALLRLARHVVFVGGGCRAD